MAKAQTKSVSLPGADKPVEANEGLTLIQLTGQYIKEAETARRDRLKQNKRNRDTYLSRQDWSHKREGQSREFLPKLSVAVEQFVAFAKKALTQLGPWYSVSFGKDSKATLSELAARNLLDTFFDQLLVEDNKYSNITTLVGDALKSGSLESLMTFKVHGGRVTERKFSVEPPTPFLDQETGQSGISPERLVSEEIRPWRLRIDLIRQEDYYPDPTGKGLYEIHRSEQDLSYIMQRAEEGIYDKAAVDRIKETFTKEIDQSRSAKGIAQATAQVPSFRKKVMVDECWGSILNEKSEIIQSNVFWTIANNSVVLRKPTPNPFWHQESPFITTPLIRVPHSTWHKALYDDPSSLNIAVNELFNLMLDGGLASVWGTRQLRIDDLDNPLDIADGIPQGATLNVRSTLPHGAKVLETVTEGKVPPDAMAIMEMLSREFAMASLSNEIKQGNFPSKQIRATEIVEASQSQGITLDAIAGDIEKMLEKLIRKAWLTILQNLDDVSVPEIVSSIGAANAIQLAQMSKAERFATFANSAAFKVHGLSSMMAKVRDFQKLMAALQSIMNNPILLQAFFKRYSGDKVLAYMLKALDINPDAMARDEQEQQRLDQDLQELAAFTQLMQNGESAQNADSETKPGATGFTSGNVGGSNLPAEINQAGNPLTGMVGT